jgi:hypothetical protein
LAIGKRSGDLCIVFEPFETDFGPFQAKIAAETLQTPLNPSGAFETSVYASESTVQAIWTRTSP